MFHFGLIFLLLANVSGLKVTWNDTADFDEAIIRGVNDGSIKRIALPTFQVIFPGTLWCGKGNISQSNDNLGLFKGTDRCCRTHDMCDDIIESGETRYNLTNTADYTRLSCECDMAFYDCLKKTKSLSSIKVGFLYFTMLGTLCYQLDYPIKKCKRRTFLPCRRCLKYEFNYEGEKKYQWFDLPLF